MLRALALLIVAAFLAAATPIPEPKPLQPPVPSASERTQPNQDQRYEKPAVSGNDDATSAQPVPTPNFVFAPKVQVETHQPRDQGQGEPPSNWWLVGFTAALVVAAFFTYLSIRSQAVTMQGTLDQMKIDAQLARDGYAATHTPKLVVRYVRITNQTVGQQTRVKFQIVNRGSNKCMLSGGLAKIEYMPIGMLPPPMYLVHDLLIPLRAFEAGQSEEYEVEARATELLDRSVAQAVSDIGDALYFFGYVTHHDVLGINRTTAFCRRYDWKTDRFNAVDDLDWEYVD